MEKYVRESRKIGFDLVALLLSSSPKTTTPFRCHIQKQQQRGTENVSCTYIIWIALNKQVNV